MAMSLNTNGYGGVLPVGEWPVCDKVVAQAWDIVAKLETIVKEAEKGWYDPGDNAKNLRNALESYKKSTQHWAQRLEELKHGPVTRVDAIEAWKNYAKGMDKDVAFFAGQAKFTSLSNMLLTVGKETAKDVKEGVSAGLMFGIPVIVLALVALILYKTR